MSVEPNEDGNAADLLVMLETLRDKNIPLHKVRLAIECGDNYYDCLMTEPEFERSYYQDGAVILFRTRK